MKIRIKDEILDLANCFVITVGASEIHFESGGDRHMYRKGVELTIQEFDTLYAWLLNQANNPHTVVV